jgi:invasion protein IalB
MTITMPKIDQGAQSQPIQRAKSILCLLAGALSVAISSAAAQQPRSPLPPAQAEPPRSESPQRTTATYASWVLECETKAGLPQSKICDIAQAVQAQVQGRSVPFSRIAVAHPVEGQPVKLVIQMPVSVTFSKNVQIQTAEGDPGIAAPFARCVPGGCIAEFDLKEDTLKKFRAASGNGKVSFADATGQEVAIPLSFNGFNQAFEALSKE